MKDNYNSQLQFLDLLNIASFCIGLMNLDQNLTQNDKQELEEQLNTNIQLLLNEIHMHLAQQDQKMNLILQKLEGFQNDS